MRHGATPRASSYASARGTPSFEEVSYWLEEVSELHEQTLRLPDICGGLTELSEVDFIEVDRPPAQWKARKILVRCERHRAYKENGLNINPAFEGVLFIVNRMRADALSQLNRSNFNISVLIHEYAAGLKKGVRTS